MTKLSILIAIGLPPDSFGRNILEIILEITVFYGLCTWSI